MGRRKPFIDKKTATTYSLLYNDAEETGGETSHRPAQSDGRHVDGRPDHSAIIAELRGGQEAAPVLQLPEEKRREIVALGFPDDGYDYLKHLKEGRDETQGVEPGTQDADSTTEGTRACLQGRLLCSFRARPHHGAYDMSLFLCSTSGLGPKSVPCCPICGGPT